MHGDDDAADRVATTPYLVRRGGSRLTGAMVDIKATTGDTGGSVTVSEFALGPWAAGPVQHLHESVDAALSVLAGRLDLQLGEQRLFVDPGDFVWMPRRVAHGFSCASDDGVRALALALPGGLEVLFREQAAYPASAGPALDPSELDRIGRRHGARTLGPPVQPRRAS